MFVRRRRRRDARGQTFRMLAAVCMDVSHMFVRRRRRRDARGQTFRMLAAVCIDVLEFPTCLFVEDVEETLGVTHFVYW